MVPIVQRWRLSFRDAVAHLAVVHDVLLEPGFRVHLSLLGLQHGPGELLPKYQGDIHIKRLLTSVTGVSMYLVFAAAL